MAFVTALLAVPCEIALSAGNYENLPEVLSAEQDRIRGIETASKTSE